MLDDSDLHIDVTRLLCGADFGTVADDARRQSAMLYAWSRGSADASLLQDADAWKALSKTLRTVGELRRFYAERLDSEGWSWSDYDPAAPANDELPAVDEAEQDLVRVDVYLAMLNDAAAAMRCAGHCRRIATGRRHELDIAAAAWTALAEMYREVGILWPEGDVVIDNELVGKNRTLMRQFCQMQEHQR